MAVKDEPCTYGCGVYGQGEDLLRHEREEHTTCTECGEEPRDDGVQAYPVTHKPDCPRLAPRPLPPFIQGGYMATVEPLD